MASEVKPALTAVLPKLSKIMRWLVCPCGFQIHQPRHLPSRLTPRLGSQGAETGCIGCLSRGQLRRRQKAESRLKGYRTSRVLGGKWKELQVRKGKVWLNKEGKTQAKGRVEIEQNKTRWKAQWDWTSLRMEPMATRSSWWASSVGDLEHQKESGLVWEREAQKQWLSEQCDSQS